jgi:hypothetical protein
VSGPLRRRRVKRGKDPRGTETAAGPAGSISAATAGNQLATRTQILDPKTSGTAPVPAKAPVKARKGKGADDDDDLGDVADILRRHGIT